MNLNLIDLSLKNVLLRARSWWTGRKRRRPEDEGAPVVHVFQGEGRRRLKRTEDRHRWLYFSCAPGGGRLKGQSMASSFFRRRTQLRVESIRRSRQNQILPRWGASGLNPRKNPPYDVALLRRKRQNQILLDVYHQALIQ